MRLPRQGASGSSFSSTENVEIVLSGPPMGKERVRFSRATGRAFTPEKTVNYEGRLALAAQHVMDGRSLFTGSLSVEIVALMPIAASWPKKRQAAALAGTERPTKKPDLDNVAKLLDGLNLIVWADDAQIVELHVAKFYSAQPSLTVRVQPLELTANEPTPRVLSQRLPGDGGVRLPRPLCAAGVGPDGDDIFG